MSKSNHNNQAQKNGKNNNASKFQEKFIAEGQSLMRIGLPQKQLAFFWKVDEDTITNWKAKYPAFSDALKKGEADRNVTLLSAMFRNATEKDSPALQIFLAKNWLGMKDQTEFIPSQDFPMRIQIVPATNGPGKKG